MKCRQSKLVTILSIILIAFIFAFSFSSFSTSLNKEGNFLVSLEDENRIATNEGENSRSDYLNILNSSIENYQLNLSYKYLLENFLENDSIDSLLHSFDLIRVNLSFIVIQSVGISDHLVLFWIFLMIFRMSIYFSSYFHRTIYELKK